uniref:Uncharacterized protein n=1 Tax=Amphiprion ocellaris TaxID=80972 RepID=A0AAQ5ZLU1_AMPOC
ESFRPYSTGLLISSLSAACMFCTENRPGWSDRKCTALNMDGNATHWKHIKIQSVRPHSGTVTCPHMENCVKADASLATLKECRVKQKLYTDDSLEPNNVNEVLKSVPKLSVAILFSSCMTVSLLHGKSNHAGYQMIS